MKLILSSFLFLLSVFIYAQDESPVFNNKVKLKEGIYTSPLEIIENNPKYPLIKIEPETNFWIRGYSYLYFYDSADEMKRYHDTIQFLVYDGMRFVYYKDEFHKLIQTGAVSTFIIQHIYVEYKTGYATDDSKLLFWDLETGIIEKFNIANFDEILKRDTELYSIYSKIPKSKRKQTLYYYLLKYNERNPVYIEGFIDG